jgi:glucose/arabinose dehydrogenase
MLKTKLIMIATGTLLLAAAMSAQQAAPQKAAQPDQSQSQPPARNAAQLANIRIELTITDQRTEVQMPPKTVTLLVEDRQSGRIRTGRNNVALNVDARPEIVRDNRVRLLLSLEYMPQDTDRTSPMAISETVAALLEDGKPLIVSQSADPSSDRKVRVELKATIVR